MANPDAFDRDFGYLMPFLDKVAAAAAGLEEPSARDELTRILSEEKARWNRVRELLRGAPGGKAAPASAPTAPAQTLARSSADGINRVAPRMAGFTVGSLKGSR